MSSKSDGGRDGGGGKSVSSPSGRQLAVRVKTAGKRTLSSARWLQRQLNDPYVVEAQRLGYRSRAAFKLIQLDEKYRLLRPGLRVVDLGAAPGGWSQVAAQRIRPLENKGRIVALDYLDVEPIAGVTLLQADFLEPGTPALLRQALDGDADLVMSDMAAPATGHRQTDHLRIVSLAEAAYVFAAEVLAPGGSFLAKVLQGGAERDLLEPLKRDFKIVRHAKPAASRADSAESYVLATGFRASRLKH